MSARTTAGTIPDGLAAAGSTDPTLASFSPVWPNQTIQIALEVRKPRAISRALAVDGKNRGMAGTCGARAGPPASLPAPLVLNFASPEQTRVPPCPKGALRPEIRDERPQQGGIRSIRPFPSPPVWSPPRCASLLGGRWTPDRSLRTVTSSGSGNPGRASYNNLSRPPKSVSRLHRGADPGRPDGNHSGTFRIRASSSSICSSLDSLSSVFQSASRNSA